MLRPCQLGLCHLTYAAIAAAAFPPGRSAHMAVAGKETGWKEGRRHAVESDLKAFFDTVNHDRLMRSLLGKVRCRKTLGLI